MIRIVEANHRFFQDFNHPDYDWIAYSKRNKVDELTEETFEKNCKKILETIQKNKLIIKDFKDLQKFKLICGIRFFYPLNYC